MEEFQETNNHTFSFICFVLVILFILSITCFNDKYSHHLRLFVQNHLNLYFSNLAEKTDNETLTKFDKIQIHGIAITGIIVGYILYPEAGQIFQHCIYGDGSTLKVKSDYFKDCTGIKILVNQYGPGLHGPLYIKQSIDYRLSLAFNPFYLEITPEKIKIYCPNTKFTKNHKTYITIIPIGKLNIKINDSIFTAIQAKPFLSYSEWERTW